MRDRFAQLWNDHRDDLLWALGAAVIAFAVFGLGRAIAPMPEKSAISVETPRLVASVRSSRGGEGIGSNASRRDGGEIPLDSYVASKNGTKYYLPSCSGVKRIHPENRITFRTEQEARASGYEPAKNCPGLAQ